MDGCLPKTKGDAAYGVELLEPGQVAVEMSSRTQRPAENRNFGFRSTSQIKTLNTLTNAVLVTSPSQGLGGYKLVTNMFAGTGYWATRPNMLHYRSDFGASAFNGVVYLIGGLSNNATGGALMLNKTVMYDAVYQNTTELAEMPEARSRFGWQVVNISGHGIIVVIGGAYDPNAYNISNTVLTYNITADLWSQPKATTFVNRTDTCAGLINGKIYLTGGYDAFGTTQGAIEVYDPVADTFTLMDFQLSIPRGDCSGVTINDVVYILGGPTSIQPAGVDCSITWWLCYQFTNVVETFTATSTATKRVADMNYVRGDFGCALTANGTILVAGGEHHDFSLVGHKAYRQVAQPWVEEYNPQDNYWTLKAPLPEARFRFNMALADDFVYAFGGQPSCPSPNQANQTEAPCILNGLNNVDAFQDVTYASVYLLQRNPESSSLGPGTTSNRRRL